MSASEALANLTSFPCDIETSSSESETEHYKGFLKERRTARRLRRTTIREGIDSVEGGEEEEEEEYTSSEEEEYTSSEEEESSSSTCSTVTSPSHSSSSASNETSCTSESHILVEQDDSSLFEVLPPIDDTEIERQFYEEIKNTDLFRSLPTDNNQILQRQHTMLEACLGKPVKTNLRLPHLETRGAGIGTLDANGNPVNRLRSVSNILVTKESFCSCSTVSSESTQSSVKRHSVVVGTALGTSSVHNSVIDKLQEL